MFSKSNLLSTLVAALWGFLGGYLIWGLVGDPYLSEHLTTPGLMKEAPDFLYLTLGCLVVAFALSTIYGRWGNGIYGVNSGAKLGLWIAILIGVGEGLVNYGTVNLLDLNGTLVNMVLYIVHYTIMGLLIGLVYQKTAGVAK
jgi:hypothetical protein